MTTPDLPTLWQVHDYLEGKSGSLSALYRMKPDEPTPEQQATFDFLRDQVSGFHRTFYSERSLDLSALKGIEPDAELRPMEVRRINAIVRTHCRLQVLLGLTPEPVPPFRQRTPCSQ